MTHPKDELPMPVECSQPTRELTQIDFIRTLLNRKFLVFDEDTHSYITWIKNDGSFFFTIDPPLL